MNRTKPQKEPIFGLNRHRCIECKHLYNYRKKAREAQNGDFLGVYYVVTCTAPDRPKSPIMSKHKEGAVFQRNPLMPAPCMYWEPVEGQKRLADYIKRDPHPFNALGFEQDKKEMEQ